MGRNALHGFRGAIREDVPEAVQSLQLGAHTEALALQDQTATDLYRGFVALVTTAYQGTWASAAERLEDGVRTVLYKRISGDLRRYAIYVRLWLKTLIEGGEIPAGALGPSAHLDLPVLPILGRRPVNEVLWAPLAPLVYPPGWAQAIQADPDDPEYRPAS
jgi:hypothetical protein